MEKVAYMGASAHGLRLTDNRAFTDEPDKSHPESWNQNHIPTVQ